MPIRLGQQSGMRRCLAPSLMLAGFVIGSVAISRATYPQEDQKPPKVASPAPPGEAEVRSLLSSVTKAYNQADAKGLAARFTDDAVLIDSDGEEVRGRDSIGQHYAKAFGNGPTCKISGEVQAVHFLSPDVASVAGQFQLQDEEGAALSSGLYNLIAVRKEGQWQLAELRDGATATSEAETQDQNGPLRELEWLVGEWVDEGEDGKVATSVRWDEDQKFLVRKYSVQLGDEPVRSGTQWIGWDPQAQQIRSWNFDSAGGFGEGRWTRLGEAWIIKAAGVTGDGLTTTATQVLEHVNKDAVKFQSNDRIVGDEVLPDIDEVLLVRKPPAPASEATPAQTPAPSGERNPSTDRR